MLTPVVLAIDPGLSSRTGIAVADPDRILARASVRGRPGLTKAERQVQVQASVDVAAEIRDVVLEIMDRLDRGSYALVLEGFEDQGLQRGRAAGRFLTPYLIGALAVGLLADHGVTPTVQVASKVLNRRRGFGRLMDVDPGRVNLPGWELLRNEHERSAACHALFRARELQAGDRAPG